MNYYLFKQSDKSVYEDFLKHAKSEFIPLNYIIKRFDYGQAFRCLQAMNVRGGKVLLPVEKFIARPEQAPNDDDKLTLSYGYDGDIISEI